MNLRQHPSRNRFLLQALYLGAGGTVALSLLRLLYGHASFLLCALVVFSCGVLIATGRKVKQGKEWVVVVATFAVLAAPVFLLPDLSITSFVQQLHGWQVVISLALAVAVCFIGERYRGPMVLLVVAQVALSIILLRAVGTGFVFSDDHPSFLYRLALLREHFPAIPFYNTDWNAGYQAREFFPSGVLNVFFLSLPLLAFSDLSTVTGAYAYNWILIWCFFLVAPWSTYLGARLLGCSRLAGASAGLLALYTGIVWERWLLLYGTLGFCLSIALLPLCIALLFKTFWTNETPSWLTVLSTVVCTVFVLFWPLALFMLLPLALIFLPRCLSASSARVRRGVAVLLVALISLPWMVVFAQESRVFDFLQGSAKPVSTISDRAEHQEVAQQVLREDGATKLKKSYALLLEHAVKAHPLLLVILALGIPFAAPKAFRWPLSLMIGCMVFIGLSGAWFKPQLELHRFLLAALFPGLLLVALWCERLHLIASVEGKGLAKRAAQGSLIVFVFCVVLSPMVFAHRLHNAVPGRFLKVSPEYLSELSAAIAEHGGEGRVFIAGFILHELGATSFDSQDGGHVAPLPLFSSKPFYGYNFYHTSWSTVDPMPASFRRRKRRGVEEFLSLVNATSILTFSKTWSDYLSRFPHRYQEVHQSGRFRLWQRIEYDPTYLLSGEGAVRVQRNAIFLTPQSREIVLKFRYHEHLRATPPNGVRIQPYHAFDDDLPGGQQVPVHFVKLVLDAELVGTGQEIRLGF